MSSIWDFKAEPERPFPPRAHGRIYVLITRAGKVDQAMEVPFPAGADIDATFEAIRGATKRLLNKP